VQLQERWVAGTFIRQVAPLTKPAALCRTLAVAGSTLRRRLRWLRDVAAKKKSGPLRFIIVIPLTRPSRFLRVSLQRRPRPIATTHTSGCRITFDGGPVTAYNLVPTQRASYNPDNTIASLAAARVSPTARSCGHGATTADGDIDHDESRRHKAISAFACARGACCAHPVSRDG